MRVATSTLHRGSVQGTTSQARQQKHVPLSRMGGKLSWSWARCCWCMRSKAVVRALAVLKVLVMLEVGGGCADVSRASWSACCRRCALTLTAARIEKTTVHQLGSEKKRHNTRCLCRVRINQEVQRKAHTAVPSPMACTAHNLQSGREMLGIEHGSQVHKS